MKDVVAVRGSDVIFACQVINVGRHLVAFVRAEPTILLTWQYRVFASRPHKYNLEVRGDTWLLEVRNVQPSDEGLYMCQVNTNPMMAQMAYLSLKVPPRIDKERTTHDVTVQEGQNVTLSCAADGSPTPTISWRHKDGAVIVTNSPEGYGESVIFKQNLTLHRVTRKHMGEYLCLASNDVPPDESWSTRLHVHFPPTVRPVEAVVLSTVGTSAVLSCVAEAWPKPELSWEFRGNVIVPDQEKYCINVEANRTELYDTLTALTIDHLAETDSGTYFCAASNEYGSISAAVELRVEKSLEEKENEEDYEQDLENDYENQVQSAGPRNADLNLVSRLRNADDANKLKPHANSGLQPSSPDNSSTWRTISANSSSCRAKYGQLLLLLLTGVWIRLTV